MNESIVSTLKELKRWRSIVHLFANGINSSPVEKNDIGAGYDWYNGLLALPVSRTSMLGDSEWDFNADEPNACRNVEGPKLRIDFDKYDAVNRLAMLEIKIAMYFYLKFPAALKAGVVSDKVVKPNTAISRFKAGLAFINTLSQQARMVLTSPFFDNGFHGLAYFDAGMYREAAKVHPYAFGPELEKFFGILRSHYFAENLFDSSLPHVELETLSWAKLLANSSASEGHHRILPNDIFEKASREASLAVVDFLEVIGEPVHDAEALRRRNAKKYSMAARVELDREKLDFYAILRMRNKGCSTQEIESIMGAINPLYYSTRNVRKIWSAPHLNKSGRVDEIFRIYINFVSYSACYLVAQYTGMRPSELAGILVDSCLQQENNYWLITSNVIKHRAMLSKLFDDKWIAIPIVRDAIRVAQFVSKIKNNPYLFSNVDTVETDGVASSMVSAGIAWQFDKFFSEILTAEEYSSLKFSPYTLRHTLAFQMARAEVGLPFISYQLKHFGNLVGSAGQNKSFSADTLSYGAISDLLSSGGRSNGRSPRDMADREYIENFCDPEGNFAGPNAEKHKAKMKKAFDGYMAAGYTKDQIFDQMVKKRIAVINVGQGFCYGGQKEDFDDSLPCIGSLRCNPIRCKNAVVTKANAPKWREVYTQNAIALASDTRSNQEEIRAAMDEAKAVLKYLGEEVEV